MRTDEKPHAATLHITVMGGSQVGKSALAVRYLTKRFIGEYRSDSGEHLDNVQPYFSNNSLHFVKKFDLLISLISILYFSVIRVLLQLLQLYTDVLVLILLQTCCTNAY